jgi:riboflavin transporter FmnP
VNSKTIAVIVSFSALAIALNIVRVPTVFWPGQYFHIWEIPVIVAFLLFGFRAGFLVAVFNGAGQLIFFPSSAGVVGPPWGIIVMLNMFLGVYLAKKLSSFKVGENKNVFGLKPVAFFTAI